MDYTEQCYECDGDIRVGDDCYSSEDGYICTECIDEYYYYRIKSDLQETRAYIKEHHLEPALAYNNVPIDNWDADDCLQFLENEYDLKDYFEVSLIELDIPFDEDWYRER